MAKAPASEERSAGSERLVHSPPARGQGRAPESQLGNVVLAPHPAGLHQGADCRDVVTTEDRSGGKGRREVIAGRPPGHRNIPTVPLREPVFLHSVRPQRTVIMFSTDSVIT